MHKLIYYSILFILLNCVFNYKKLKMFSLCSTLASILGIFALSIYGFLRIGTDIVNVLVFISITIYLGYLLLNKIKENYLIKDNALDILILIIKMLAYCVLVLALIKYINLVFIVNIKTYYLICISCGIGGLFAIFTAVLFEPMFKLRIEKNKILYVIYVFVLSFLVSFSGILSIYTKRLLGVFVGCLVLLFANILKLVNIKIKNDKINHLMNLVVLFLEFLFQVILAINIYIL